MSYFVVADGDNVGSHLKSLNLVLMASQSRAITRAIADIRFQAMQLGAIVHVAGGDDIILECDNALSAMSLMSLITDHFEWTVGLSISVAISEKLTTALNMLESSKQMKM